MKTIGFSIDGKKVSTLFVNGVNVPLRQDYFYIETMSTNASVSMLKVESRQTAPTISLEYATDPNGTWSTFEIGTTYTLAEVGDKMYFRAGESGNNILATKEADGYNNFVLTGSQFKVGGCLMSLLRQKGYTRYKLNETDNRYAFCALFDSCTGIVDASEMNFGEQDIIPNFALANLFWGCSGLVTAPRVIIDNDNADERFNYIGVSGCAWMFDECTSLVTAPEIHCKQLRDAALDYMCRSCTSLTTKPVIDVVTVNTRACEGTFIRCSSLVEGPDLMATSLTSQSYFLMFLYCTSLSKLKVGWNTWNTAATLAWLTNASTTGTLYCSQALIDSGFTRSASTVPDTWTLEAV